MRRFATLLLIAALATTSAGGAAAVTYFIEVQSSPGGVVSPSGMVEVEAGGSQTFTFTPFGCLQVGQVTVDDVPVGTGITEYTFTNVQSDHILYAPFGAASTTTTLVLRPEQCAAPETLIATVANGVFGDVSFYRGGTLLGTRALIDHTAMFVLADGSPSGPVSYAFSASYLGSTCANPSDSPLVRCGEHPEFCHEPLSFATILAPRAVAVGDVNGDALPDLVTTRLSVLLGKGDGTFQPGTEYGTVPYPTSVAIADIDADGRADVVASGNDRLSVLLGHADGTLGPKTETWFGGSSNTIVAVADLDADGRLDLAMSGGLGVRVFMGLGDGTFSAGGTFPVGGAARHVAIADFNGDGKPDLAVASSAGEDASYVSVLLGNGDGTFGPAANFPVLCASGPFSVAVGDLNGDGRPDLVTGGMSLGFRNPCGVLTVLLGHGDGTFTSRHENWVSVVDSPIWATIGDFNADARPDIAVVNGYNLASGFASTLALLPGNGDGTFQPVTQCAPGHDYYYVTIADLNGDGGAEVIWLDLSTSSVHVLVNQDPPPVATLMAQFEAVSNAEGIELR